MKYVILLVLFVSCKGRVEKAYIKGYEAGAWHEVLYRNNNNSYISLFDREHLWHVKFDIRTYEQLDSIIHTWNNEKLSDSDILTFEAGEHKWIPFKKDTIYIHDTVYKYRNAHIEHADKVIIGN